MTVRLSEELFARLLAVLRDGETPTGFLREAAEGVIETREEPR